MLIREIFQNCSLYSLPSMTPHDPRGLLWVIESTRNVSFEIKRVYFLTDTPPDHSRGLHAHRKLQQYALCVSGSCTFDVENGRRRESVTLNSPDLGLYMGPMLWHEMRDFSADCVLLVLASAAYDESDYIRSYEEFQVLAR